MTRETLGAWLVKGNPAVWDLAGYVDAGAGSIGSWAVRPGYRSRLMTPGDPIVFWVSGPVRGRFGRGIWGAGRVTGPVREVVEESPHWLDQHGRDRVRSAIDVDLTLTDEPVLVADLLAFGVDDLEVQRAPWGPNPSWLSRRQWAVVQQLLPAGLFT